MIRSNYYLLAKLFPKNAILMAFLLVIILSNNCFSNDYYQVTNIGPPIGSLRFSSIGHLLFFSEQNSNELFVFSVELRKTRTFVRTKYSNISDISTCPMGKSIALAHGKNGFSVVNCISKKIDYFRLPGNTRLLKYSSDGKVLITVCDKDIWICDFSNGLFEKLPEIHKTDIISLCLSNDSKIMATGCAEGNIVIWDLLKKKTKKIRRNVTPFGISALGFGPGKDEITGGLFTESLIIWNVDSMEEKGKYPFKMVAEIESQPDEERLFGVNLDGNLFYWVKEARGFKSIKIPGIEKMALKKGSFIGIASNNLEKDFFSPVASFVPSGKIEIRKIPFRFHNEKSNRINSSP